MATYNEVVEKLLDTIFEEIDRPGHGTYLLNLAEAYAWLKNPGQAHGGHVSE
jgi:hypothetical protein